MVNKKENSIAPLFTKDNYLWMGIGAVIIALGMFLMSGGKNADPKVFDYKVVYSTTRVTIAPILVILGLLVEVYAIFKKPKQA
ncbi:MAG: DUF3098 domain-containing protein [Chitinophaga sp.]|jgi:Protein of unknown function (DUF3098)|nr:DUF3098 domain-containing protein [Chitinophaga sp.]